jgi:hypothetical protein
MHGNPRAEAMLVAIAVLPAPEVPITTTRIAYRSFVRMHATPPTVFVPKLKKAGASDEILRQIIDDSPRRFLAFVPKIRRKADTQRFSVYSRL